jgi:hypothetical protein
MERDKISERKSNIDSRWTDLLPAANALFFRMKEFRLFVIVCESQYILAYGLWSPVLAH